MSSLTLTHEDKYLAKLLSQTEKIASEDSPAWLKQLRHEAIALLLESHFPNKKQEEWRFTDLAPLTKNDFQLATPVEKIPDISEFILPEASHSRLVYVNGFYTPSLSDVSALPEGIYVGNGGNLPETQQKKLVEYLGKRQDTTEVFTTLNTAALRDVAVIWVNPNVVVDTPIHLLFLAEAEANPTLCQPRVLVIAEKNSFVNFIEYYGALTQGCFELAVTNPYLTNTVTEIFLGENAFVKHSRLQRESTTGFHLANTAITQARDSQYSGCEVTLGAQLSRHNLSIWQIGEQTQTTLNNLTMISGSQVSDTHSLIALNHPHGTTNQLHKCLIDGRAQAIFNGKVLVPQAAQMTNAAQLNRNLLLSPRAKVNTKPELQITADNVKCSHGATVSQLEADEIFYLRSRGLNDFDARHLLMDAFAAEIIDKLPLESLRTTLTNCVGCKQPD